MSTKKPKDDDPTRPYDRTRRRRETHVSAIIRLHVVNGIERVLGPFFAPDSDILQTLRLRNREAVPYYIPHDHDVWQINGDTCVPLCCQA